MRGITHPDGAHPEAVAVDHGVGVDKGIGGAATISCVALH